MLLPVTLVTAAAIAVIHLWLSFGIVRTRVREKVLMGDNGHPVMLSRMRSHANLTENAPIVLILIAGIELARGASPWLWLAAAAFVVARVMHPLGMTRDAPNPLRAGGAMITWTVVGALAIWAAVIAAEGSYVPPIEGRPVPMTAPA